ncbi:peptidyl-prolyl cis-trans isomerase CYP28, chloroplastic [Durio zibethinus]|uniref:Peptidyl-prolyl cis-trans isomerase n=1 Tax=Durio zibethinus TaxID=66656 RepID=A0A6P5XTH2_DURZI|nr:peptidyl-prolyl cis-trans isomerase CYP28, chloroplastic [Durio zibethinus]
MASPLSPIPPGPFLSASSTTLTRRSLLLSSTLSTTLTTPPLSSTSLSPPLDTTITDRVFLDFSLCPTYFRSTLPNTSTSADSTPLCSDPTPLGRLVLGLYGNLLPLTVSTFKLMCTSSSYKNTLVHKIFPGQFFQAGRQGRSREYGEVHLLPALDLPRNIETVNPKAFLLAHSRAGIVSLCLSENDDDNEIKLDSDYRNVEFLITTGPGPCPQLDNNNIVFGTVLEGLDVVTAIASIPTYKPSDRIRLLNDLAEFFGDERAQKGRALWNRPLKTVYISDCGELQVTKPSMPPSLP